MVKTVVTKIYGGLGNQMFQYAAGKVLSQYYSARHWLDVSNYKSSRQRLFALDQLLISYDSIITKPFSSAFVRTFCKPLTFSHQPPFLTHSSLSTLTTFPSYEALGDLSSYQYLFLDGYFQAHSHLTESVSILISELIPRNRLSVQSLALLRTIRHASTRSVSVHIRRGDYISNPEASRIHGTCSIGYYLKAIDILSNQLSCPEFFFFSDDQEWCKTVFSSLNYTMHFAPHDPAKLDCEDLFLMSSCSHHIIANSTYSWWAAFLNTSKQKIVVAPSQWFKVPPDGSTSPVPPSWTKI